MDIINIEIKVRKVEQIMEKIQDMDLRKMLLELEEKLHYHFKNKELLITALTHSSYANES